MRNQERAYWRSERIINFTLTEIMVLIAFIFLIVVAVVSTDLRAEHKELTDARIANVKLKEYRETIGEMLRRLGFTLPDNWDYTIALELIDERLLKNEKHKAELEHLRRELEALREKSDSTESERRYLVKRNQELLEDLNKKQPEVAVVRENLRRKEREIAALNSRIEQLNKTVARHIKNASRYGRTDPSCIRDENEATVYIFEVVLFDDGVVLTKNLPKRFESKLKKFNLNDAFFGRKISNQTFRKFARPFYRQGQTQDPSCRYYVAQKNRTSNGDHFLSQENMVTGFFFRKRVKNGS